MINSYKDFLKIKQFILYLMAPIILFSSCNSNESKNTVSNIEDNVSVNTENKAENIQENILVNENIGIFLPEYYVEKLNEKKSHVQAAREYYNASKNYKIALILFPEKMIDVYNFHDAGGDEIIDVTPDEIIFNNNFNKLYIIDNTRIRDENDIVYECITKDINHWQDSISAYITKIIFGENVYSNNTGEEIVRLENGNILYKNIEYEINLGTIFSNNEYDYLSARNSENIHFKINNETCEIYNQKIPDGYYDKYDVMVEKYAEYTLIDAYKQKGRM